MKKIYLIILIFLFFPVCVYAGGNNDDNVKVEYDPVPEYKVSVDSELKKNYQCKYRMIFEEVSPVYTGSFDIVIEFSKTGGVNSMLVNQVSQMAEWTYMFGIGKLEAINNLPNDKIYFESNKGYYCPHIMAYIYDENYVGYFKIEEWNQSKFNTNIENASVEIYYPLHSYYYSTSCGSLNEETCRSKDYCNWVIVDSGHKDYACVDLKYGSINSNGENIVAPDNSERTEKCSGYSTIMDQELEYSFNSDGSINAYHGGGMFGMHGSDKIVDKEGQLYDLWKNGKCCSNDRLAITYNYNPEELILSCDGSKGNWNFDDSHVNTVPAVPGPNVTDIPNCESLLGAPGDKPTPTSAGSPAYYLNVAFKVLRYVAIIILIVLSVLDFIQATAAKDDDAIKKATTKTIIRLILCVVIFVLPTFVEFLLQFLHDKAQSTCGVGEF